MARNLGSQWLGMPHSSLFFFSGCFKNISQIIPVSLVLWSKTGFGEIIVPLKKLTALSSGNKLKG